MTQHDASDAPAPAQSAGDPQGPADSPPIDYQTPPQTNTSADAPSWFGYIGLGIAIFSLLIGAAGMVLAAIWFIGWTRS